MTEFDLLCRNVLACTKCTRMSDSVRVLNRSVGSLTADIMFIGEAPGRLGADDSGIPFHGDKSGHNFEELIENAGLNRLQLYITNAVLCNPKDEKGNNSTPTSVEMSNCSSYLEQQISLVNPKIIVTLGATALAATDFLSPHKLILKEHVRTANKWFNRILIPLYHPGQRAMLSRSMANQRSDYQFVADQLKKLTKRQSNNIKATSLNAALLVDYLFSKKSSYTYFAIHKLFYLIEYRAVQSLGYRLTNSYIIRQKDGPYCTDLNLFKLKKALPYIQSKPLSKTNILLYKQANSLFEERLINLHHIPDPIEKIINEVIELNATKSNAALKRSVYFTQPMRNILYVEQTQRMNLYNSPIEFNLHPSY